MDAKTFRNANLFNNYIYISCSEINGYLCHYRIYPVDDIFLFDETKHVADIYIMGFENFLIFAQVSSLVIFIFGLVANLYVHVHEEYKNTCNSMLRRTKFDMQPDTSLRNRDSTNITQQTFG